MSAHSKIEWTDATWNPLRGCTKISPGCTHCYAESFAERFRGVAGHPYEQGFDLRLVPEKLSEPLRWKKPKTVFVNSMSDLFHEKVPDAYIQLVVDVMTLAPWHVFQVLTKRADRMKRLLSTVLRQAADAPHIWWGVSVENRRYGLPRLTALQQTPARVRFLSIEPLLEGIGQIDLTGIDWVIVGGESGIGARPMQKSWVTSLRDQCAAAHVPFFFKQWGGVQKAKTGRALDGRFHDDQPPHQAPIVPGEAGRRAALATVESRRIMAGRDGHDHLQKARWCGMSNKSDDKTPLMFPLPESTSVDTEPMIKPLSAPVWTSNKARLIERYLYYFVLVTKHGTYIDGFAGPQEPDSDETWAAKLVLESEPRLLRHFHLFDSRQEQIRHLSDLKKAQPAPRRVQHPGKKAWMEPRRTITIHEGDFNQVLPDLLHEGTIRQDNEAIFCLLDQRTFECHWATVEALARYKTAGKKVELFYFLPNAWLDRALTNQKNEGPVHDWWGGDGWERWRTLTPDERKNSFVKRFKDELGYWSVKAWPIYEKQEGGRTMYYMIHATDHPEAPLLMARAYANAVNPRESPEQLLLELGL